MEHHCGQVKVLIYGHMVEKPVFCGNIVGAVYVKTKGSYQTYHLLTNGTVGEGYSWTELVIFDEWVRTDMHIKTTCIYVRHLVETTKQRILGKVR
jgi:hypothetical protein